VDLPSGWTINIPSGSSGTKNVTITHNLGRILFPNVCQGSDAGFEPRVVTSDLNNFVILVAAAIQTKTNILVKI
jgi:hypothetical protein